MKIFSRRGSAVVEAAIVYPITVLAVAGIISCSFTLMDRLSAASEEHLAKHERFMEDRTLTTEDALRAAWKLGLSIKD